MQGQFFNGQVTIVVQHPQLKGGATKHHQYRIHGSDKIGEFDISRRYSDFILLKQQMALRWPGLYIPSLPQKKFLGNNQSNFLQIRRQGLQNFLKLISAQQNLWYADQFQLFIKSKNSEVEKLLSNLGKTNNRQIAAKYRSKFVEILQKNGEGFSQQQLHQKISQFRNYLKNSLVILEKMGKVSELMTESHKKFNEKYDFILSSTLVNFEIQSISQYVQDKQTLQFMNSKTNGVAECASNLSKSFTKNQFAIVNQLIKEQIREVVNFQQLLKNKQEFQSLRIKALSKTKDLQLQETKINAGKQSLLSKIKSTSKQQQLQNNKVQLTKARQQLKDAQQICQIVDKIFVLVSIGQFKSAREKNYYHIVQQLAKAEKNNASLEQQVWTKVIEGSGEHIDIDLSDKKQKQKQQLTQRQEFQQKEQKQQEEENKKEVASSQEKQKQKQKQKKEGEGEHNEVEPSTKQAKQQIQ